MFPHMFPHMFHILCMQHLELEALELSLVVQRILVGLRDDPFQKVVLVGARHPRTNAPVKKCVTVQV